MLPYSPLHHLLLARRRPAAGDDQRQPQRRADRPRRRRRRRPARPAGRRLLSTTAPSTSAATTPWCASTPARLQVLRRSRGYAPEPMGLPFTATRPVLAVGAELKSTSRVAKHDWVVPSHHIGDLEHLATYRSFLQAVDHLPAPLRRRARGRRPRPASRVPVDQVGGSTSTCRADRRAAPPRPRRRVHGRARPHRTGPRASPSTGSATAPTARCGAASCWWPTSTSSRGVGHLRPVRMPGGVAAIREPWRMGAVWAAMATGDDRCARTGVRRRRRARRRPPRCSTSPTQPSSPSPPAPAACSTQSPRCSAAVNESATRHRRRSNWRRWPARSPGADAPRYDGMRHHRRRRLPRPRSGAAGRRAARRPRRRCRPGDDRGRLPRGIRASDRRVGRATLPREHGSTPSP